MSIHHLDCGTMRPRGSAGGRLAPTSMVAHCLVVERPEGIVLVDTGFGSQDVVDPHRLGRPFRAIVRPELSLAQTAHAQLLGLGLDPADVTDIVLTHLDLDHAGGIGDFPRARVHVYDAELDAALRPTAREKARYVSAQWAHGPTWVRHTVAGDQWRGLGSVTVLGDDLLLVPLHGHTRGHCGVAVRRPDGGWLLHAGDSYFHTSEKQTPPSPPVGLRVFQRLMAVDDRQRRANQERLRELHTAHGADVTIFSAHDVSEYAALTT
ncbi:unannotated protein [freshwater metagenome]|uniref:Unannotated protein n=1 Tax=freshwater metagenome TaxID=449393 RepID=A0A6J6RLW2_9ZZZZ